MLKLSNRTQVHSIRGSLLPANLHPIDRRLSLVSFFGGKLVAAPCGTFATYLPASDITVVPYGFLLSKQLNYVVHTALA